MPKEATLVRQIARSHCELLPDSGPTSSSWTSCLRQLSPRTSSWSSQELSVPEDATLVCQVARSHCELPLDARPTSSPWISGRGDTVLYKSQGTPTRYRGLHRVPRHGFLHRALGLPSCANGFRVEPLELPGAQRAGGLHILVAKSRGATAGSPSTPGLHWPLDIG